MICFRLSRFCARVGAIELQPKISALESDCNLSVDKERLRATPNFLRGLARLLTDEWRTLVTPTQAWQVWIAIAHATDRDREQIKIAAEISYWYGFDATTLGTNELSGFYANLPRIKAQHTLINQLFNPLDYELVYHLTLVAYEDEQRALAARSHSMRMLIDKMRK